MNERQKIVGASGEFYPSISDYCDTVSGARVLLAEGDDELRHFFSIGLRKSGYAVLAMPDGKQTSAALSSIARGHLPRPDAVVMEVNLRIHSGLELLGAMRHADWPVPVILMASGHEPRVRALADRLHVFRFITKPLSTAKLLRTLDEAVGRMGPRDLRSAR